MSNEKNLSTEQQKMKDWNDIIKAFIAYIKALES